MLTMTVTFLKTFSANFLEYKNFVGAYTVINYSSAYRSTLHVRLAYGHGSFIVNEQHFVECNHFFILLGKTVNKQFSALFHLELLSGNIYNCVHKIVF